MNIRRLLLLCLFGWLGLAWAGTESSSQAVLPEVHPDVQTLLNQSSPPDGVVFDIETLEEDALARLAPYLKQQIHLLKNAYPEVDIAVVTHGAEEYALQKQAQAEQPDLHQMFNALVEESGVSVHVCGAVGGLKGLTREDFPAFVSYSDSGMAQLNDYKALGYAVVTLHRLTEAQRASLFKAK